MRQALHAMVWLLVSAIAASSGGTVRGSGGHADGTPAELLARVTAAVTRDEFVYHVVTAQVAHADGRPFPRSSGEAWLDGHQDVSRQEQRKDPALAGAELPEQRVTIYTSEGTYFGGTGIEPYKVTANPCPAVPHSALKALLCEAIPSDIAPRLDATATYEGQPALALVYEERGEDPAARGHADATTTVFLERATALPLAVVSAGRSVADGTSFSIVTTFAGAFIPREALPADFFDPAAIGYVEKDVAAPLDDPALAVPVHWLGRRFAPGDGLPPVVLTSVFTSQGPRGGPGNRAGLDYDTADGLAAVRLSLWRPDEWAAFIQTPLGRLEWDSPCARRDEVVLPHGRAVIFMTYEPERRPELPGPTAVSPGEPRPPASAPQPFPNLHPSGCPTDHPFDRFLAHVYLEDVVVAVNMAHCFACVGGGGPYDTLAGMDAVVRGLRLRAPGD